MTELDYTLCLILSPARSMEEKASLFPVSLYQNSLLITGPGFSNYSYLTASSQHVLWDLLIRNDGVVPMKKNIFSTFEAIKKLSCVISK